MYPSRMRNAPCCNCTCFNSSHQMSALVRGFTVEPRVWEYSEVSCSGEGEAIQWVQSGPMHPGTSCPLWTDRQTETTENINFPQLRWRAVNIAKKNSSSITYVISNCERGNLLRGVDPISDVAGHVMFCKQCKWCKDFDCMYYNSPKFDQSDTSHSNDIEIILFTSHVIDVKCHKFTYQMM